MTVSRFRKLSHVIWHCQYHIVWVPKYRFRILDGPLKLELQKSLHVFCGTLGVEIVEMSIQKDHVHMLVMVPPKVSISELMGTLKGRAAIRMFKNYPDLKTRPYWGNHFWANGYCVDTVGLDEEMIRTYVRYQEKQERMEEKRQMRFKLK